MWIFSGMWIFEILSISGGGTLLQTNITEPRFQYEITLLYVKVIYMWKCVLLQDMLDDAIEMFVKIGKWEQALQLASDRNHPDLDKLRAQCKEVGCISRIS